MKDRLMNDLKEAMKSTDANKAVRLASVKAVRQAVTDYEKSNPGKELTEEVFAGLVDGLIKSREKSVEAYISGGRQDLADVEQEEINIIKTYLPERVDDETIREAALAVKSEIGATSMKEMGQMMGILKSKFGASAKPADVSRIVKEVLS